MLSRSGTGQSGLSRNPLLTTPKRPTPPENCHQTATKPLLQSIATSAYRPTPPFLWLLEPSWPKIEGVQNTCTRAHPTEYLHTGLDFLAASKTYYALSSYCVLRRGCQL